MNRTTRCVLSVFALAALAIPGGGTLHASVFVKEDVASLKRSSEAVVHARVVDVRSYWNDDASMIFTDVTLEVKRRLHGAADDRLVVRVPGGTVEGFTAEMLGAPKFEVGEDVVVFVARWRDGVPMVAGYFQGKSRVNADAVGNLMLRDGAADGLPMSDLARQLSRSGR